MRALLQWQVTVNLKSSNPKPEGSEPSTLNPKPKTLRNPHVHAKMPQTPTWTLRNLPF